MATTNFSGPITAGNIRNTTGTIVGTDVKNTGQVLMGQSFSFAFPFTTVFGVFMVYSFVPSSYGGRKHWYILFMNKKLLFINAEGIPFGFSASANKIRLMGEIISQSDIDVYCLNKRKGINNRKYGFYKGIKFAFFNAKTKNPKT